MRAKRLAGGGVILAADVGGDRAHQPIMFLHGTGQTRAAWGAATLALSAEYHVISLDLRGHGESDWAPGGDYRLSAFVADLRAVCATLAAPPIMVGASLGGMVSMLAAAEGMPVRALVLVDIVPDINPEGAEKVGAFLKANRNGFASVEAAADAVSAYQPHRARPRDISGLRKNLRLRDGRLYWHWDPELIFGPTSPINDAGQSIRQMRAAARKITAPTLLLRGMLSTLVDEAGVKAMRDLIPHAEVMEVGGASHMIAGDRNDAFNACLMVFLKSLGAVREN